MPSLKETIEQKVKEAMKNRDELTVSTLRLIRSAIRNKEIELKKALEDADVVSVIQKMMKQAKESLEQFEKGGRQDLVKKVKEEIAILKPYLPQQLNVEDLKNQVQTIITEVGATSLKEMGQVMKSVSDKLSGQVDMKKVSEVVRSLLKPQ